MLSDLPFIFSMLAAINPALDKVIMIKYQPSAEQIIKIKSGLNPNLFDI
jgi:hypothetical protein